MDREAAVVRAEMSRTREQLDQKLSLLQDKVNDMTPRRLAQRYMPEYFSDRVAGDVLTLIGLKMAWAILLADTSPRTAPNLRRVRPKDHPARAVLPRDALFDGEADELAVERTFSCCITRYLMALDRPRREM